MIGQPFAPVAISARGRSSHLHEAIAAEAVRLTDADRAWLEHGDATAATADGRPRGGLHMGMTTAIGRSIPRIDGEAKVTGSARFAADHDARGLLHGRPVLALPAHARIERIDRDAALAVPGVVAVLTAADLPITAEGRERLFQPLARSEIAVGRPTRRARGRRDARRRPPTQRSSSSSRRARSRPSSTSTAR